MVYQVRCHRDCPPEELDNLLQRSDSAYADAEGLSATLHNEGLTILCVLPSKFAHFLPRQTGAALFRTTIGDFEALFRPKEQNFDDVFISETKDRRTMEYDYTFRDGQGRKLRDMIGRETFFLRRQNILFLSWQKNTSASLESTHVLRK